MSASELDVWFNATSERLASLNQAHVLAFWDELKVDEKESLRAQVEQVDWNQLNTLTQSISRESTPSPENVPALSPSPVQGLPVNDLDRSTQQDAQGIGESALREGQVAAFLVAGGQGTRLGFDGPKGAYEIGPVTGRSIFQLHAEKIQALRNKYQASIPWVIMTSTATDEATRSYFHENQFFGLSPESIRFIVQENMPAVGSDGRALLGEKSKLVLSPNGHGGSIKALYDSGTTEWLREQGVTTLFYFQVDNILTKICDPVFIGYHLKQNAQMSSKVVRKRDWQEPVGVIGFTANTLSVIEYSDLPEALAQETDAEGNLRFWAGSIAIHALDLDFINRLNQEGFKLPYHQAAKRVPCLDANGNEAALRAKDKNGIKFETFVFDALSKTQTSVTMETVREEDFGPVKNPTGNDSVESAQRYLIELYAGWLEKAGHTIPRDSDGLSACPIEISPLTSLFGEALGRIKIGKLEIGESVAF